MTSLSVSFRWTFLCQYISAIVLEMTGLTYSDKLNMYHTHTQGMQDTKAEDVLYIKL